MYPALVLSVISLALCVLLFLYFRWYIKRRSAADELLAEYRTEVQRLLADIDFATERNLVLLEDKIAALKKLLEETDSRISVYTTELERSRSGAALYTKLGQESRSQIVLQVSDEKLAPPDEKRTGAENTDTENAVPEPAGQRKVAGKKTSAPAKKRNIRMQVAELSQKGYDAARIASKLKVSVSEVELILSLLR